MNQPITKTASRSDWKQFLLDAGPYRYHITITFKQKKYGLPDAEAFSSLNFLLHILNRKIFGAHYKERYNYLTGFAFAERHQKEGLHFHLLIKDHPKLDQPDKPSLKQHLSANLYKVKKTDHKKGRTTYELLHPVGIDIEDVYSDEGIVDYLTKTMEGKNRNNGEFIIPLSKDGLSSTGRIE
jgi:hypothetical protein